MQQYFGLGYRIDLYFPKHKFAIEVDENGQKEKREDKEKKRIEKIEKKRNCKFIGLILIKLCCQKNIAIIAIKHTDNIGSKKAIMTNKVIIEKSKCASCVAENSKFLKQKSNKKSNLNKINPKLFIY